MDAFQVQKFRSQAQQIIEEDLQNSEIVMNKVGCAQTIKKILKLVKQDEFIPLIIECFYGKHLYYVRHAESVLNKWKSSNPINFFFRKYPNDPLLYDPKLTQKGVEQCSALKTKLEKEIKEEFDKVFVSPLERTLKTYQNIEKAPNFKNIDKKQNIIITHLIRESGSQISGNIGKKVQNLKSNKEINMYNFKFLSQEHWWRYFETGQKKIKNESSKDDQDFSLKEINEKETFKKEPQDDLVSRLTIFFLWTAVIPEKNILIISHAIFNEALHDFSKLHTPRNTSLIQLDIKQILRLYFKYLQML